MSVPSTNLKHKYEGNGTQTEWPFTFKVFTKEEILVKKITSGGETTLVLDTDYSVSGAGADSGGGFVTYPILGTALQAGEFIVLKPNFEYSQKLILLNQNTFPPKNVEYGMDRLAMQIKQVAEELSRSLQLTDAYDGNAEDFIALITAGSAGLIASLNGTSVSSVSIGTGSKTFTTQSGKSWALGQRLRAASDDGLKIVEGPVTAYSGTSLTIGADFSLGSGSHADWNISIAGQRGASGAGSGDMIGSNNGTDFASALTTFNNLKQQATTSLTGVARLATQLEVNNGVSTNTIVTPETLEEKLSNIEIDGIILQPAVSTTSGTSIDLSTTIPAGVKRININLAGLSTNGSDALLVQIGDSGGIENTGYLGSSVRLVGAGVSDNLYTAGFGINSTSSSRVTHGNITLTLLDATTNTWVMSGVLGGSDASACYITSGSKSLSATLDRVRLTTTGGTNTFDAGKASISWEH